MEEEIQLTEDTEFNKRFNKNLKLLVEKMCREFKENLDTNRTSVLRAVMIYGSLAVTTAIGLSFILPAAVSILGVTGSGAWMYGKSAYNWIFKQSDDSKNVESILTDFFTKYAAKKLNESTEKNYLKEEEELKKQFTQYIITNLTPMTDSIIKHLNR